MDKQQNTEADPVVEVESPTVLETKSSNSLTRQSLWHKRLWHGWRRIVIVAIISNILAFLFNCILLGWAISQQDWSADGWVIWKRNHEALEQFVTLSHLAINIVSSIILAGSNYTLQILLAPTRAEIDQAHQEKRFLDIGISSLHNWRYLSWRRRLLYISLLITTLPIHLLYNSIIVSTVGTIEAHGAGIVTKDFLQIPISDPSPPETWFSASNFSASDWTNMSVSDCLYSTEQENVYDYANVLFFTDLAAPLPNSSWRYGLGPTPELCNPSIVPSNDTQFRNSSLLTQRSWIASFDNIDSVNIRFSTNDTALYGSCAGVPNDNWSYTPATIESCLVQRANINKIELIPQVMVILMVCNLVKAVVSSILVFSNLDPLVTVGDSIASFLDIPDATTRHIGPIAATTLQQQLRTWTWPLPERYIRHEPWKVNKRRYTDTVTRLRWGATLGFCVIYIWSIIGLLIWAPFLKDSSDLQDSFGTVIRGDLGQPNNMSLLGSILLVNAPQLALSGLYLGYNTLFTCMLLSKEWINLSKQKKSLRVTKPHGQQRPTYFLSLPFKYSVPLMLISIVLHWILSQSMFSLRVDVYTSALIMDVSKSQQYIGLSQTGLMLSAILTALFIIVPVSFGKMKLNSNVPLVQANSLAISAACQHSAEALSAKELRYGVVAELPSGRYRVGFSDGLVKPMVVGQLYES